MYMDDIGNQIGVLGIVMPQNNDKKHQRNLVYDIGGVSGCETSTQYKDSMRVLVIVDGK